ncbi:TIGR01244 family sulfur transferase [Methylobacterium aerolatum]|uniref:Uncharacterized protein (TIGR01244 family) n=1 Tax=Methylobacterium aerolatum TaxID=418708 RepID=A0ABU0I4R7_9HYPH|nr:TIGR01244 family sulfur transferase [Methylobacterium aerolatum]MDQ0449613.1 uncharacterized protein (TIGR01244 family) [Methylobacterium aerolatum]GJD36098.1 Beta-lactamase hydrolase-like protein [Methylobacterium aerolatum]
MTLTPITPTFAVASQPAPDAIAALAETGTVLLINNRPDGEEPGQPGDAAEAQAAAGAGLAYRHLPVTGDALNREDVARFRQALREADGPVVAHCRSGTRSLTLWVIGEVLEGHLAAGDVTDVGARHGFDLSGAVRWLRANGEA